MRPRSQASPNSHVKRSLVFGAWSLLALYCLISSRPSNSDGRAAAVRRFATAEPAPAAARTAPVTTSHVSARAAAETPTEASVRSAIAALKGAVDAELARQSRYATYLECRSADDPQRDCRSLLSDALYAAMTNALEPALANAADDLRRRAANDSGVRKQLDAVIARTRDPSETLVAVSMLQHLHPDDAFPLPRDAYRGLAERTDPEAQMIMAGHMVAPLPDQRVRDDVAAMALSDAQPRVKLAAVRALSEAAAQPQLARIVAAVLDGSADAELMGYEALPFALGRCAAACSGLLEQLASADSDAVRRIAYRALERLPPEQASAWQQQFVAISPISADATLAQIATAGSPFGNNP